MPKQEQKERFRRENLGIGHGSESYMPNTRGFSLAMGKREKLKLTMKAFER